jgi:hypothetical protein
MTRARGALQKKALVWKVGALGHRMTAEVRKTLCFVIKNRRPGKNDRSRIFFVLTDDGAVFTSIFK